MSLTKQDLTDIRDVVLEALDVAVNPRLDSLENHVDSMENRMGSIESKMDSMENRMGSVEGRMGSMENRMDSMETRMGSQESAQRETNRQLMHLQATVDNIDGRLLAIEADVKELYNLIADTSNVRSERKFTSLAPEQKVRQLYREVLTLAKQLHVEL